MKPLKVQKIFFISSTLRRRNIVVINVLHNLFPQHSSHSIKVPRSQRDVCSRKTLILYRNEVIKKNKKKVFQEQERRIEKIKIFREMINGNNPKMSLLILLPLQISLHVCRH